MKLRENGAIEPDEQIRASHRELIKRHQRREGFQAWLPDERASGRKKLRPNQEFASVILEIEALIQDSLSGGIRSKPIGHPASPFGRSARLKVVSKTRVNSEYGSDIPGSWSERYYVIRRVLAVQAMHQKRGLVGARIRNGLAPVGAVSELPLVEGSYGKIGGALRFQNLRTVKRAGIWLARARVRRPPLVTQTATNWPFQWPEGTPVI